MKLTHVLPVFTSEPGLNLSYMISAEFGTELLVLSLFLLGFGIFRVSLRRHALHMRLPKSSCKSLDTKVDSTVNCIAVVVSETEGDNLEQSEPQAHHKLQAQAHTSATSNLEERLQLLCRHASSGSPSALELFENLVSQSDSKLSESALASVVAACADSRNVQLAERCADYAREVHGKPALALYTSLMRVYSQACLFRKICELDKTMQEENVKLDNVACAMIIKAHGLGRHADRVWALWTEVIGCGNGDVLNEELFSNMVEACILCGDLTGVADVLRQTLPAMEAFPRAAAVFAAVVKSCVQSRRLQLAVELYHEIKEVITCTRGTYSTLIDALVSGNDMGTATDLFRDMALHGVELDLFIYSTLIKGHCIKGDLEKGLQLMGVMQRRGIAPDAVLFNSILDGCAHKQMRTLTEMVLKDMEKAAVVPSNHTMCTLVRLYGRCGDLSAAFSAVDMYPKKFSFRLNAEVYTCLMSACIANGDQTRALTVYDTMVAAGCMAGAKCYQTLLKGCLQHEDVEGADRIVNDVFSSGNVVSIFSAESDRQTLEGILLMAVRKGRTSDIAKPLLQRLQAAHIGVSERICSAVTCQ